MSATEVMSAIDRLSRTEQEEVFAFVTSKIIAHRDREAKPPLAKKLSCDDACDLVFRENRELLELLAK